MKKTFVIALAAGALFGLDTIAVAQTPAAGDAPSATVGQDAAIARHRQINRERGMTTGSAPSMGTAGQINRGMRSDRMLPERFAPDAEFIVDAARWAPSGGNIQPWRFEADANQIRLYLVPERTTTMDVRHRGSYVAIGAALFNARVAAASLKNLGECQLFPEGSPSHHVATLMVGDSTDYEIARVAWEVEYLT